jgi:hypothetical protein
MIVPFCSHFVTKLDVYSVTHPEATTRMIVNKKAVVSAPALIPRLDGAAAVAEAEMWCNFNKLYIPNNENCMEPYAAWLYPIVPSRSVNDIDDFNGVKGTITTAFYWRSLIKDMLPPESKGIVLVFSNECAKDDFTYHIDGPKAKYVSILVVSHIS